MLSCIFIYLAYKLSTIGWANIFKSLPTSPLFYVLALVFVSLPIITEKIVFGIATDTKFVPPFKMFIRKHVINKAVMNYAGEGYFVKRLSDFEAFDLRSAAIIVKNLTLARAFAANFWIILLVLAALMFGNANVFHKMTLVSPVLVAAVSVICVGVCAGAVIFFQRLTSLDWGVAGKMCSLYLFRSFLAACVLITQWSIVIPGTVLSVWLLFLTVFFISKKSPIGGDLVFVSVALTLPGLEDQSAAVAAMLLMNAAILQLLYSLGFVFTSEFSDKKNPEILKGVPNIN